ncbi:60S ribosomal protein L18a-like [Gossypium hirsutum]|uniref:60S ribosomal protein L18a-like n=1 Tax=Gossypium hirsutum TaxID=3635 RepID=A0A1U8KXJ2_GOSHI|nr:60S ribosomal protein L18a-like [Gossypium hirsutum]
MLSNKVKRAHPLQVWAAGFAIAILKQQVSDCILIFEKNPTKIKNYGIWLRYQSRTGYHNMYKEYRDTTLNGAVEQKYTKMASRHRVRFPCIQIIKTATIPAKLCKRSSSTTPKSSSHWCSIR